MTLDRTAEAAKKKYRSYLLTVLMTVLMFNYMDRLVFGMVMQSIKTDLLLTDTQLGFLSGLGFALFYAVMGLPIARWADRGNRVIIIGITTSLWSAATALCGAASSFVHLLLARVGVAVGEAGCHPASLSLIADEFDRGERPRAVARYSLGVPLGMVVGSLAAGWLNQVYGWRAMFIIVGLPGVAVALVAALTLREPRKVQPRVNADVAKQIAPPFKEVVQALSRNAAYRNLLFYFTVWGFFGNGLGQWQPTFFMRSRHLESGELGTWLAIAFGVGGLLGNYMGGELAVRWAHKNEKRQLDVAAIGLALVAIVTAGVYTVGDKSIAFSLLALQTIIGAAIGGPVLATIGSLVPAPMRAMSVALVYFCTNLIGLSLGPLAVGILSDALQPIWGDESLRYALLAFCPGYFWCGWHIWRAGRTVARDIARSEEADPG